MFNPLNFLSKFIKSNNEKELDRIKKIVTNINSLEDQIKLLSDDDFPKKTLELKQKIKSGKNLNELLPEAFALVREASKRTRNERHYDVQLIGGVALHEGKIAEMRTGEGKTLTIALAAYLNALNENGVHIVTVNDYLAKRDAEWMQPIYEFLGLSVGVIFSNQQLDEKEDAYKKDIIYATNNELGFDYLRDNMAHSVQERVQCSLDFAIIDEVDSILIDEARTPLIISGPSSESSEMYKQIKKFIPSLIRQNRQPTEEEPLLDHEKGHYFVDEKNNTIELTDDGYILVEDLLQESGLLGDSGGLYSISNLKIMKFVQATLRANFLFNKNVHYLVRNNQVLLIDEHTGRTMPGRRMSEGVHQALECKENVPIQRESQTLASTTFQNFFRLFSKLSGMTGTADTEATEFQQIYGLSVIIIPTNVPMARDDHNDLVFLTKQAKYNALVKEIQTLRLKSAPILVGTVSVESSEQVSEYLKNQRIPHQILNAKHHEKEAEIIANAGKPGMVTIATNMAGRGTDIVLGGKKEDQSQDSWIDNNKKVIESGGLHILGTERHESRRIDNQLRGRSGRQGDPGYSRFFLSLEDDLLRLFISDSRRALFDKIGMGDDHIEHRMLSKGIENAQKRIESRNFDARKNLLEYDDVSNDQRQAIYSLRNQLLEEQDISQTIDVLIKEQFILITNSYIPIDSIESQWKADELQNFLEENYSLKTDIKDKILSDKKLIPESIASKVVQLANERYTNKYKDLGENRLLLEKQVMLQVLDVHWKEHLAEIDHLRNSVGLRAYAQKNPKNEFKKEAYSMFESMLSEIDSETIRILFSLKVADDNDVNSISHENDNAEIVLEKKEAGSNIGLAQQDVVDINNSPTTIMRNEPKLGRNDLVKITNGTETKTIKYKKAKSLIENEGWQII